MVKQKEATRQTFIMRNKRQTMLIITSRQIDFDKHQKDVHLDMSSNDQKGDGRVLQSLSSKVHVFIYLFVCGHAIVCTWRSKGNLHKLFLFFYHVGPGY